MSGAQYGTVIGGAIGAYFGGTAGAQIGMAVGGAIGGAIDPTKIKGPRIGDGQAQTAQDGIPIAWVMGEAMVGGTICAIGPRTEVKKTDGGKGSGTEQVTYEAHMTFAILICESDLNRDSKVRQIFAVEQDGQIVYDIRPDSTIREQSATWGETKQFYYGDEDQAPPAELEAIFGIGNTPGYRGVCLMVCPDFNLTKSGDRIPTFRFIVGTGLDDFPVRYTDNFKVKVVHDRDTGASGLNPYYAPGFDDSVWDFSPGGFGSASFDPDTYIVQTPIKADAAQKTIWLRTKFYCPTHEVTTVRIQADDIASFWWNGEKLIDDKTGNDVGIEFDIPSDKVKTTNIAVLQVTDELPPAPNNNIYASLGISRKYAPVVPSDALPLGAIVRAVCKRGGLSLERVEASSLDDTYVIGYPVATVANATETLAPLLAAYFAYASEYNNQLNFRFYGEDAVLTVNPLDVMESDSGTDGSSLVSEDREQATEFPRRVTTAYYDPTQYFSDVHVNYERTSVDVLATGELQLDIPVVMDRSTALKATVKALKVSYASLEGKREYSLPYVGHDGEAYLSLAAGESVLFGSKRWVIDEMTIGYNELHFKTTYSRQSAYTTSVQAIPLPPAVPPVVGYVGTTTLYAMNLPSLRPQDTYGIYLAANGDSLRWPGATVEISYDGGQTWSTACVIVQYSDLGVLTAPLPVGGTSLSVNIPVGELVSVGPDQIAAQMNAAVILSPTDQAEIIQFQSATSISDTAYNLTGLSRGLKDTLEVAHSVGDRFTMTDSLYFVPVDLSFGGETLMFRAVTANTKVEDASVVSIVYKPDDTVILDGGGDPL